MVGRLRISPLAGIATAAALAIGATGVASAQEAPPPAGGTEAVAGPQLGHIADGVRVGGVEIGGLTRNEAVNKLLAEVVRPANTKRVVRAGRTRFAINPRSAGLAIDVRYAVRAAYNFGRSRPVPEGGGVVPLPVRVNEQRIQAIVRARAGKFDRSPRDASIRFRGVTPIIAKARFGRAIDQERAAEQLTNGLLSQRQSIVFPTKRVRPERTTAPPTVLVNRNAFQLTLFANGKRRNFRVAVGQPAYPTPPGTYKIVNKIQNPTWTPPNSTWAAGIAPVPPGPANPLGTRWMGFDRNLIGIHGTPNPGSLGTRASHGCIRMSIPAAEWLFGQVGVGSRVVVV